MQPKATLLATLLLATLPANYPVSACTNLVVARDGVVLAANNLDTSPPPRLWFIPGGEGLYGRMCFGTDEEFRIAEGGVNERGLFIAVNALKETGWTPDPELPSWEEWSGWYGTGVPDGILANCATVDEAVAVFRAYNLLTLAHVKFLLADRSGASAIVEWGGDELAVISRSGAGHQVSTNVLTAPYAGSEVPSDRHRTASQIIASHDERPTKTLMRRVLSATHLEGWTPTIYSASYDLIAGRVDVYYFHNFEEVVTFDLADELKKGRANHLLADLFTVRPVVEIVYK